MRPCRERHCVLLETNSTRDIGVGSSVNFRGGETFLPEKLVWGINKIPEFYMIFARKMPEFYIIIARTIFFPNLRGHVSPLAPRLLRLWRVTYSKRILEYCMHAPIECCFHYTLFHHGDLELLNPKFNAFVYVPWCTVGASRKCMLNYCLECDKWVLTNEWQ